MDHPEARCETKLPDKVCQRSVYFAALRRRLQPTPRDAPRAVFHQKALEGYAHPDETHPGRTQGPRPAARCTRVARALQMAPKSKAKAKGSPEAEPVEVEPPEVEVTDEALEAARQLKLQEKMAMRAAREAEVAEQTAKMNFEVKVNETVEEGRKIEQEIQEAKDLGLSPFKAVRMRRKSKELEANANDLLSAALDKIFLECNCESKMWPLPRVAFRAGSTSP